jgi:V8-like Glu-specific endopeptidase
MNTKKLFCYIAAIILLRLPVPRAYAAAPDPSPVVEVLIWDANIQDYSASASGVMLNDNKILTNYHVAKSAIDDPKRYQLIVCLSRKINTFPGCGYTAFPDSLSENSLSQDLDLALLDITGKIDPNLVSISDTINFTDRNFPKVTGINLASFGTDISQLKIKSGAEIQTLGYPADTLTYTKGHIIGHEYYPSNDLLVYVHIDAKLNSGSSGGAVYDSDGNFVGVTPGGWRDDKDQVIQSYFIPVTSINWWLDELRKQPSSSFSQTILPLPDNDTVLKIQSELCKLGDENYCVPDKALSVGGVPTGQEQLTLFEPNQPKLAVTETSAKAATIQIGRAHV